MTRKKSIPMFSVIIPMYNMEKYIGECLDSILAQTFQDYEVIVVDDCSTDNSCAAVENYIPKFTDNGESKLQLIRKKTNAGGAAIPRNIGMKFAHGNYLMFLDSDDLITETALEEIYQIIENFQADVIHCEKFFKPVEDAENKGKIILEKDAIKFTEFVDKPTLMPKDLSQRLLPLVKDQFDWSTYTNIVRRNFVLRNNIEFAEVDMGEDIFFTIKLLTLAENVVRIPNIFYIYRMREDSLCNRGQVLSVEERIKRWVGSTAKLVKLLADFMQTNEFFKSSSLYRYLILDLIFRGIHKSILDVYATVLFNELEELVHKTFSQMEDITALCSFVFVRMNVFNVSLIKNYQLIVELQNKIQQKTSEEQR